MEQLRCGSVFALALGATACAAASSRDGRPSDSTSLDPAQVATEPAPLAMDPELTLHGTDLELDVAAEGRALVVSGGLNGLRAVSWGPDPAWQAPVELMPAIQTLDPTNGSYREVLTRLHEVALGSSGEAWVLYSRLSGPLFEADSRIELYAQHRPSSGSASSDASSGDWEPAELVATLGVGVLNDPTPVVAALALGASGHVGVVWAQRSEPLTARVRDPGQGWSMATALDSSEGDGNPLLAISADGAGNLLIVWQNATDTRAWQGTSQGWASAGTVAAGGRALSTIGEDGAVRLVSDSEQGLVSWQRAPAGSAARENLGFGAHHYLYDLDVAAPDQALLAYAVDQSGEFTLEGPVEGLMVAQELPGTGWSTPEQYDVARMNGIEVALNSRGQGIVFWNGSDFGYRRLGTNEHVQLGTAGSQYPRDAVLAEDGRALLAWSVAGSDDLHVRWVE